MIDIHAIQDGKVKVALIGLGYVGLPLAVAYGKKFDTVGFDVKESRLELLRKGVDLTRETSGGELAAAARLRYSSNPDDLRDRDVFIVTVPTPVDRYNRPDLTPLYRASETVGRTIKPGAIVVFESTVYPGCTEEECVPVIERYSGLKFNRDFFCGYSPERINPGDKQHTLTKIMKITSGSTPEAADAVDALYNSILSSGTFRASSIKVAEAAKVIENSQRDINIAFVNELAKIFHLIGIDTHEVLKAASTKWNFLHFQPGLVGGHCIGVDPYYLTHKAQSLGYHPEVILAGRRINDNMAKYVVSEVIKLMIRKDFHIIKSRVLQLGVTFKENCPDIRNSKSADVAQGLMDFGCQVDVWDPWADPEEAKKAYGLHSFRTPEPGAVPYDAVVLAVPHKEFTPDVLKPLIRADSVVYDIKGVLPDDMITSRL